MSTSEKDTAETVEKLLAERRKVASWISALAAKRAETPPAVYQKVHDDYTAKLEKVQAKLVAASDSVQVAAVDVASRLTEREEALAKKRDERAEAELRAAVGEFSEREWEKRRTRLDDEVGVVTGERDTLRDELRRLRDVLAEVAGTAPVADEEEAAPSEAATPAEPEAAPDEAWRFAQEGAFQAVPDGEAPRDDTVPESSRPTPVNAEIIPAPPTIPIHEQSGIAPVEPTQPLAPSFDELAFLKSVVGRPTPVGTFHPMEPALVPKRTPADTRRVTPSPKRASATQPPAPPEEPPAPPPSDATDYATPEPPTPFPDPVPEPRVSQEMTPPRESYFGRPTPRTSEAIKSLRCQECGTLNFPTEWYCERCGGELAAF
ncbi:MAG: zinc finger Ran-binding domain-containing protein [Gemmatimonadaceae bacterium]